jgi:uncharacterized protein
VRTLINRRVPMTDGVELATDVYLPDGPGPFPTIIARSPYHRHGESGTGPRFVERGYAYVAQDVRGKHDSDGDFEPLVNEAADGHSLIDWAANQSWCNGRIGLWGRSYLGIVQLYAAALQHPALHCIAPSVAPGSPFRNWIRSDGIESWGGSVRWWLAWGTSRTKSSDRHFEWGDVLNARSLDEVERITGMMTDKLRESYMRDVYDDSWRAHDVTNAYSRISVPGLHAGGWWDYATRGVFNAYKGISSTSTAQAAREGQRLIVGPWGHGTTGETGEEHTQYGEWEFGAEADYDILGAEMRCFDHYVREIDNGWDREPAVRTFLMGRPGAQGANRWLTYSDWPPPEAETVSFHLTSSGNSELGLAPEEPSHDAADLIVYDPQNPTPVRGGAITALFGKVGPRDQRAILDRADVLCYRSDQLNHTMNVVGPIELRLWIATDVADTDIVAKLCVEADSGELTVLTNGCLRARYRNSWSEPEPLVPGDATELRIDLGRTAFRFNAGDRVCVIITCSEFPRLLPHNNRYTGFDDSAEPITAHTRVLSGAQTPSRVELSIVEAG